MIKDFESIARRIRHFAINLRRLTWRRYRVFNQNGKWICDDCHKPFDYYGVTAQVWAEADLALGNNVCLLCLRKRLGRPLAEPDFRFLGKGPIEMLRSGDIPTIKAIFH